jgi:hypothetical protein
MGEPRDKTMREDSSGEKGASSSARGDFAPAAPSIVSISSFKL